MNRAVRPIQNRLFPGQEPIDQARGRGIILAVGETQIQDHAFEPVGAVQPVERQFGLVRQAGCHANHADLVVPGADRAGCLLHRAIPRRGRFAQPSELAERDPLEIAEERSFVLG